jgi:hypothetical protein
VAHRGAFTGAKWIVGVVALAIAGALSSVALGVGFVYVKVSVPTKPVPSDRGFLLDVTGHSFKRVELAMFVPTQACKPNTELEMVLFKEKKATRPVQKEVDGDFSNPFGYSVDKKGKHYACAYLYEVAKDTLARDEASWQVS